MRKKTALVTGAGRGIGSGIALQLAEAGYDVGVNYAVSQDGAEEMAKRIRDLGRDAITLQADLRNVGEINNMMDRFIAHFGHIDLLVNNAGITKMAPFLETDEALFDDVVGTDLKGAYFSAQAAAKNMVSQEIAGTIINISSNHSIGCFPNSTVYAATKAGLDKLTKNMALDLSKYGIRVVAIAPGYTDRTLTPPQPTEGSAGTMSRIPLGRFCTPQEVGDAVVYLSSESAKYITGTTLFMDGGALLPVVAQNEFT